MLALTGCEGVVVQVKGETMVARQGSIATVAGVAAGLLLLALGVLVCRNGKSKTKRVVGGALFVGFAVLFAVVSVASHGKVYVQGDGDTIVQATELLDEPEVTELHPVAYVSVHRVHRRVSRAGPKRGWVTLLWLHRPDGSIDRVKMSGDLNRPVLEHVLKKLADRGVRVEDRRDQAE